MSWSVRRKRTPKTAIERDWLRAACVERVKKLMELRTQAYSPFPYTMSDMRAYLYPPEVRAAIDTLMKLPSAHSMLHLRTNVDLIIGNPEARIARIPLFFTPDEVVTDDDGDVYSMWCPLHVQEALTAWVHGRRKWLAEENRTVTVVQGLMNRVGTYAQAHRLWPALTSFMHQDMQEKIRRQKSTRIGDELRTDWDVMLATQKVTLSQMETWMSEALLLEGTDVPTVLCFA